MSDPSLDLQVALVAALRAAPPVTAIVGARTYDVPPAGAAFPYITIGDAQVLDDGSEHIDGTESFLDVHLWSREPGRRQIKTLSAAVRATLHEAELALADHWLVSLLVTEIEHLSDPDGKTWHSVVTLRVLTEHKL